VKTIAAFRDLSQAHLAKGKLEAEGVFSILLDEYLVGIDWVYSQAIGGVKLQVRDSDVKRAHNILKEDCSDILRKKNLDMPAEVCPKCGSCNISVQRYSLWSLIPSLFFLCPIFFRRKNWRCTDCGEVCNGLLSPSLRLMARYSDLSKPSPAGAPGGRSLDRSCVPCF